MIIVVLLVAVALVAGGWYLWDDLQKAWRVLLGMDRSLDTQTQWMNNMADEIADELRAVKAELVELKRRAGVKS